MADINSTYFEWMCKIAIPFSKQVKESYRYLFEWLNNYPFRYSIPMDKNRYDEAVDLRYRFGYEFGIDPYIIQEELDYRVPSVLEMMVALILYCDEHILDTQDINDADNNLFLRMLHSLKIDDMTDDEFDEDSVKDIIDAFLDRNYYPNGEGGLFTVNNPREDMRKVEIWYQCMWYLSEYYNRITEEY